MKTRIITAIGLSSICDVLYTDYKHVNETKSLKDIPKWRRHQLLCERIMNFSNFDFEYNLKYYVPRRNISRKIIDRAIDNNVLYLIPDDFVTNDDANAIKSKNLQYQMEMKNLPEKYWDKMRYSIALLRALNCKFDESYLRKELSEHKYTLYVHTTLINNNIRLHQLDGHILDGFTFHHFMHSYYNWKRPLFIKFVNSLQRHGDMNYSEGTYFKDIKKFRPIGYCSEGGIYFTLNTSRCIEHYKYIGVYVRKVNIVLDSYVYIECDRHEEIPKFKINEINMDSTILHGTFMSEQNN
jgi:hypothetical protein